MKDKYPRLTAVENWNWEQEKAIDAIKKSVGTLEDKVWEHEMEIAFIQKALDEDPLIDPVDYIKTTEHDRVVSELKADLRYQTQATYELNCKLTTARGGLKRTGKEFEKLKEENVKLVETTKSVMSEGDKLRAENQRLTAEVAGCHKDRGCSTKTCGMLRDAIDQITCMESKLDAERETNAALVSKNQDLANRLITLRPNVELQKKVADLVKEIKTLNESVEEYRNKYETQQKFNDELRDTIKSKDREIREICAERNTYRFANIDLSQAVTTLKAKLYVREEDKRDA